MNRDFSTAYLKSPFGILEVRFDSKYVYSIRWRDQVKINAIETEIKHEHLEMYNFISKEFELYWQGRIFEFSIPFRFMKGTSFQKKVWNALRNIPYGSTVTYKELSSIIGLSNAARAVGNACGKNEIAVVIPCHRVVRSDGNVGNYSAPGGSSLKQKLLEFEKHWFYNRRD